MSYEPVGIFEELPSRLEKIQSLRKTIQYLSNQSQLAIEMIDSDPGMVKLILKEMFDQNQYTYR